MFTHTVLYASPSPDHVEKRGPITKVEALDLLRTFPFEREVRKHEGNRDLTVPTLTFVDEADGSEFALWSSDPGRYLIWVPALFALADNIKERGEILECLALFFDGDLEELEERVGELRQKYSPEPDR